MCKSNAQGERDRLVSFTHHSYTLGAFGDGQPHDELAPLARRASRFPPDEERLRASQIARQERGGRGRTTSCPSNHSRAVTSGFGLPGPRAGMFHFLMPAGFRGGPGLSCRLPQDSTPRPPNEQA